MVIEDEVAETEVFDFNEDIDTIRDLCIALEFNQTEANSQGTSLCFSAVSVAPENTTFSPIELTIPVCRPTSCSPDQALVTLSCASANACVFMVDFDLDSRALDGNCGVNLHCCLVADLRRRYLYLPGDARLACEPVAVFCEICSGCFIDQLAEVRRSRRCQTQCSRRIAVACGLNKLDFDRISSRHWFFTLSPQVLNISPDYIVVVLVLLCIVILVSTFVGVSKCRANRALSGGGPVGAGGGSRKSKRKSVSEQYYAQFEVSLQQRKNHHGDGGSLQALTNSAMSCVSGSALLNRRETEESCGILWFVAM